MFRDGYSDNLQPLKYFVLDDTVVLMLKKFIVILHSSRSTWRRKLWSVSLDQWRIGSRFWIISLMTNGMVTIDIGISCCTESSCKMSLEE